MSEKQQTVLEQLGGLSGLVSSTVPVLVFVPVNSIWGLTAAIWAALAAATAVLVWRLVQRTPVQPAVSGFLGVGVCAFIAYRTGDAKGYFLFGIYTSLLYAAGFVLSVLVRRPLVGVIWGMLNGQGSSWRRHRVAVRAYDIATAAWALVFAARYLVQHELYDADRTGWLAVARIGMGWPLTAVALLVTLWAVRRADRVVEPAPETVDEPIETGPGRAADGPDQDVR
ncbi:membrane protein [Rhodococcus ruber Chol-4]|uniref:Uncharacterized protein n=2 Tax=Rhodococcus TaxID=1827 RepID=A0A098BH93_9NOCA|nr:MULTISPECIES: DUF3159 domain-containing protein [Rhodococcus]MDO2380277.1 DUF3159 domain-containing protein [Rhodococcus ruber]RIK13598.1 MAG: DUF3159 domain-containing protein [Acidobacteriota bacterium]ATQ27626.1 DUF3159 domain-containing protein [Rhodococcus ruber]AUM15405.1 DUF3159 domain-containing protein [Rhodococcus ruber]AWG98997.1 DUF3159 domain-containing protein [Rhodococcus ruber]